MRGFVMTVRDDDLKNLVGSLRTHKVVWCLLLMEASPWLLTQVLHLQKQTGHCSLNNCGRAATTCHLCIYLLDGGTVFLPRLTCSVSPRIVTY